MTVIQAVTLHMREEPVGHLRDGLCIAYFPAFTPVHQLLMRNSQETEEIIAKIAHGHGICYQIINSFMQMKADHTTRSQIGSVMKQHASDMTSLS